MLNHNARILVVDNLSRGRLKNLMNNGTYVISLERDFRRVDLTDPTNALVAIRCVRTVYHLADVVAGIDYVFQHQSSLFRENILINTNTLYAVVQNRIPNYIYVGTACSFPKHLQISYKLVSLHENQTYPASPESSYGWSKLMGEYEAGLLRKQNNSHFKPNVAVLRFHNVYGPGMIWGAGAQAISALMFKAIKADNGKGFPVFGSGNQYRDFVFVEDVVDALLLAPRAYGQGTVQVGTGVGVSVRQLSNAITSMVSLGMNKKSFPRFTSTGLEGDRGRVAHTDRAEKILGWMAKTSLHHGLQSTFLYIASAVVDSTDDDAAYPVIDGNTSAAKSLRAMLNNKSVTQTNILADAAAHPKMRILVIVIGQPRGGDIAHRSLYEHLLEPYGADLAIYFNSECNQSTLLHQYAKYIWQLPEPSDWISMATDFGNACTTTTYATKERMWGSNLFLGQVCGLGLNHKMSSFILLAFRWLTYRKIMELGLHLQYDYFVLTRADEFYLCRHFSFQSMKEQCQECAWVQKGEEYGGWSDRHWAASSDVFMRLINISQSITCNPEPYLQKNLCNLEQLLAAYTKVEKINVKQFKVSFFTVRAPADSTRWAQGSYDKDMALLGLAVKYPNEYASAKATCGIQVVKAK
jgi:nucleoside-diphosphate-sugar epimerase